MSEVVPAVVNTRQDGTTRGWGRLYDVLKEKLFGCTEEVLGSMADFQKELVQHLDEMTELNGQIAKRNADLAMKLYDFQRDICQIRDYYDRVISSTKTVVDYGCDQKVIPHIKELIEEKRYSEAKQEINSFLRLLKKAIRRVERDIKALHEDCPDIVTIKGEIKQNVSVSDPTRAKQHEVETGRYRVFRLGASTLVYMAAGAATGLIIASYAPQEATKFTEAVTSAGSEVLSFCTGNVLTGLNSVMEKAKLSNELRNKAESSIVDVCRCLTGFFKELTRFETDIASIEKVIDELKLDMTDLQEEVDYEGIHANMVSGWAYTGKILQQMFGSFTRLSTRVVEKQDQGFTDEEFHTIMERLYRSVELTTLGTPV